MRQRRRRSFRVRGIPKAWIAETWRKPLARFVRNPTDGGLVVCEGKGSLEDHPVTCTPVDHPSISPGSQPGLFRRMFKKSTAI